MIVLNGIKLISAGRIYRPGEHLRDSAFANFLVEKGLAEVVNDPQPAKTAKKPKSETAQQNDTVNP